MTESEALALRGRTVTLQRNTGERMTVTPTRLYGDYLTTLNERGETVYLLLDTVTVVTE